MRISDWSSDVCSSDLRTTVAQRLAEGAARRAEWVNRIEAADFAEVQEDEDLMRIVRQSGQTLFRDNCSKCHGIDAHGGPGYTNPLAGAWLCEGDPPPIAETRRGGINADNPETRVSEIA